MAKNETRIHVVPDPESDGWLVMEKTDQEAFEWDRLHYGESVALLNWQDMQRDHPLRVEAGPEDG